MKCVPSKRTAAVVNLNLSPASSAARFNAENKNTNNHRNIATLLCTSAIAYFDPNTQHTMTHIYTPSDCLRMHKLNFCFKSQMVLLSSKCHSCKTRRWVFSPFYFLDTWCLFTLELINILLIAFSPKRVKATAIFMSQLVGFLVTTHMCLHTRTSILKHWSRLPLPMLSHLHLTLSQKMEGWRGKQGMRWGGQKRKYAEKEKEMNAFCPIHHCIVMSGLLMMEHIWCQVTADTSAFRAKSFISKGR